MKYIKNFYKLFIRVFIFLLTILFVSISLSHCGTGLESLFSKASVKVGDLQYTHLSSISNQRTSLIKWKSSRVGTYTVKISQSLKKNICKDGIQSTLAGSKGFTKDDTEVESLIGVEDLEVGENKVAICYKSYNGISSTHTYTIYRDDTPPVTLKSHISGAYITIIEPVLNCSDAFCDSSIYTIDGTDPTYNLDGTINNGFLFGQPLTLADSSTTTIKFRSRDLSGNIEPTKTVLYTLDTVSAKINSISPNILSSVGFNNSLLSWTSSFTNREFFIYVNKSDCNPDGSEIATGLSALSQTQNITSAHLNVGLNEIRLCLKALYGFAEDTTTITRDDTPPILNVTPGSGAFNLALLIKVTCQNNCDKVIYTEDTTDPTFDVDGNTTNGILYDHQTNSGIMPPVATTTYKFLAIDKAGNESQIYTKTYIINPGIPNTNIISVSNYYLSGSGFGYAQSDVVWSIDEIGRDYQVKINSDCITNIINEGTSSGSNIISNISEASLSNGINTIYFCC